MKVLEVLSDASKWTQMWFAKDKDGNRILAESEHACQWCLLGAVRKAYRKENDMYVAHSKLRVAIKKLFPERMADDKSISVFNDHKLTTFEDVKLVLEEADV